MLFRLVLTGVRGLSVAAVRRHAVVESMFVQESASVVMLETKAVSVLWFRQSDAQRCRARNGLCGQVGQAVQSRVALDYDTDHELVNLVDRTRTDAMAQWMKVKCATAK